LPSLRIPSPRLLLLTSVVALSSLFLLAACSSEPTGPDPSASEPSVLEPITPTGLVGGTLGDNGADFDGITNWINSDPLTIAELQGKVVLVDFWTYTCVNCIRTMPFLRDWQAKYADEGLVIVGVHAPEFEFEKIPANVESATADFGLDYPVAQDDNFTTWRGYENHSWPAKYLMDKDGIVRYTHIGEGGYDETELAIRELLRDAGADLRDVERNEDAGPEFVAQAYGTLDPEERITRELYGGWNRNNTVNGLYIAHANYYAAAERTAVYTDPGNHFNQAMFLQGSWHNGLEAIKHGRATDNYEDYIAMHVFARSANIVIDLEEGFEPFIVKVTVADADTGLDRPLDESEAGVDIVYRDGESFLEVNEGRMYFALSLSEYGETDLKFSSNSPDFALFAMTFGAYLTVD
jgi:thiol-disulfide isomerase/thioredoxin